MLPSVISNLIWGSTEPQEDSSPKKETEFDHSTSEETGDWLLINCKQPGECARSLYVADNWKILDPSHTGSWLSCSFSNFQQFERSDYTCLKP